MRRISQKFYKIKGPNPARSGSEFWVTDVEHGISRALATGTTFANFANADTVVELVDRMLGEGIDINEIAILSYYIGQKYIIMQKLKEVAGKSKNDKAWALGEVQISTVDAFQGKEIRYGIVDMVYGDRGGSSKDDDGSDSEGNLQPSSKTKRILQHAADSHRLCCALTRFIDGLVVVCQKSSLAITAKAKQSKEKAAISQLIRNAHDRGLIFTVR